MLKQKAKLFAMSLYLTEMVLLVLAFFAAYWFRNTYFSELYGQLAPITRYLKLLFIALPLWSVLLYFFKLYESQRTKALWKEIWKVAQVTFCGTFFLMAFVFIFKDEYISRLFVTTFGGMGFLFILLDRCSLRIWMRTLRRKGYNYRNILIVGTGRRAREMQKMIDRHREWGFSVIGYVSDQGGVSASQINQIPVIGKVSDLPQILEKNVVDEVIFAISRKRLEALEEIFLICEELGVRTRVAVNFFPHMIAKVHLDEFNGVPLLTFTTTPHNEMLLMAKRLFDICISGIFLVLLFPLMIAIGIVIKMTSQGPVLFRQTRVGLNGRRFTLYKFRSMFADAEARKDEVVHLNEMGSPAFKISNDPRTTPFGGFLRKLSLDEIPQLYNVLWGDMSIVGPRPPLPAEVAEYKRWQRRRLSMKPGLTCLWQVGGRSKITDFKKWMELDLRYIDNWSLKLDFKIFFKTIFIVLAGRGAS
ncbi:MAG: sugar transferase [Nitrospiria bacterium]